MFSQVDEYVAHLAAACSSTEVNHLMHNITRPTIKAIVVDVRHSNYGRWLHICVPPTCLARSIDAYKLQIGRSDERPCTCRCHHSLDIEYFISRDQAL